MGAVRRGGRPYRSKDAGPRKAGPGLFELNATEATTERSPR